MVREIASLIDVARTIGRESNVENVAEYLKFCEVVGGVTWREGKVGKNTLIYYPGLLSFRLDNAMLTQLCERKSG